MMVVIAKLSVNPHKAEDVAIYINRLVLRRDNYFH